MQLQAKTTTVVLALLTGLIAMLACMSVSAAASTGGAGAPSPSKISTVPKKVHPSGIATWFGPGFYGKRTACGQTLTPGVVGVANRTLPCGTLVKVGFKGHTLTVPVLDRGPYGHIGADWDLTAGAAEALGITETVHIQTRVVGSTPNLPTLGLPEPSPEAVAAGGALAG